MIEPWIVILVVFIYMGLLFGVALWAERRLKHGKRQFGNPLVYVLSLAVYCTTWTYYGSVGFAATTGGLFLTVYLGPIIMLILFGAILRKLVRLKNEHRITSISDFLGSRYGKSQTMAGIATIIALMGTTPYVALQLKAVISTFTILTGSPSASVQVGPIIVIAMIFFTIAFGVRRLDPTERHQGIVMAVAAQSLVKLIFFFMAGVFVVYSVYDGFIDLFSHASQAHLSFASARPAPFLTWVTWTMLSMSAAFFLPHQFHIAVVENLSERHIRSAAWMFPVYLILITLFVYPIAMAGLLQGLPISEADFFVLHLPMSKGHPVLALLVFLGGFSAAAGMIMISAMTMATMTSNHLLLPLFSHIKALGFLRHRLLGCRWAVVSIFIFIGYWFEREVGESYMLVNIGMISFAAAFQFAVPVLMGIFWKRANKIGAILGLFAGFSIWAYTSLLPSFVRSGWLSAEILTHGPLGIGWLNPEQLLGIAFPDPLSHTVFWSLVVNAGLLISGSLFFSQDKGESSQAEEFVSLRQGRGFIDLSVRQEAYIDLQAKELKIRELFEDYFEAHRAEEMCSQSMADSGLVGKNLISIVELAELCGRVETFLAGSIGSAAASEALKAARLFTAREAKELSELYGEILINYRTSPEDLWRRINFYRERETLIAKHASELEGKVRALETEIVKRKTAEARLRESEERYRTAIEHSNDGVGIIKADKLLFVNHKFAEIFGYDRPDDLVGQPANIVVHPEDRPIITDIYERSLKGDPTASRYDFKGLKKDGQSIYIGVSATRISYMGEQMTLAYLRDITLRRQAEDEIRHLSRRLIDGIEEEHKRLAADLHDELGQALTGIHLGLDALANSMAPELEKERTRCASLISQAEGLADKIRNLSTELRPAMLDDLGLVPTLRWYIEEFRSRITGIDIDFEAVGLKGRLPARVEILFYRIAQEGLTNIAKHSQASHVDMRLTYSFPQVIFFIRDNGIGFKPASAPFSQAGRGIGLIGMRERAAAVGGKIDIQSAPGKGAQIRVTVTIDSVDRVHDAD